VPAEPQTLDSETPAVSTPCAGGSPTRAADITAASTDAPTANARRLAQLVAAGRQPRSQRFTALEPYRDVLLTERRAGASIRLIAQSLAKLDVAISEGDAARLVLEGKAAEATPVAEKARGDADSEGQPGQPDDGGTSRHVERADTSVGCRRYATRAARAENRA
jgi:hypothetical protein